MIPIIGFLGIERFTPPWDIFFLPLFNLLVFLYEIPFFDFALAIIIFTIVIRTILAPLFIKQIRSQKEMQRMQPLIREVQRKHKGNRQKVSEETMALYKEHGVNPAAGCLPVILQMPILFALYQALIRASGNVTLSSDQVSSEAFQTVSTRLDLQPLEQANHFLVPFNGPCDLPEFGALPQLLPLDCQLVDAIKLTDHVDTTVGWLLNLDLARIDTVFAIPVAGGFAISLLAVVAAVLQFVQVRMTSPRPNPDDATTGMTRTMTYTFPLLTIVWGGIFPSGLILYWITYTAYLVLQQYLIMGFGNLFPLFGWTPGFAVAGAGSDVAPSAPHDVDPSPLEDPDARQPDDGRRSAVSLSNGRHVKGKRGSASQRRRKKR